MNRLWLFAVVFSLAWAGLAAGAGMRTNACRQLAEGSFANPNVSADGKLIVFSRGGKIMLLDTESGLCQVLHNAGTCPEFSPVDDSPLAENVQRICFVASRAQGSDIAIMNADGSNVKQLTSNLYSTNPHWSPDGETIYYIAFQDKKLGVSVLNVQTGKQRIISQRNEMDAVPSPDGKYLAFVISEPNGARSLGVMGVDGSNPRLIQRGDTAAGSYYAVGYFSPRWSPDGKWIAMIHSQMQPLDNIVVMSIDGRQRVALTTDNNQNASPSWTRNGKAIAFAKLAAMYRMDVELDSAGIEDRLANLGEVYDPVSLKSAAATIPPLVGPDLRSPLDVEPVPGQVESLCLNGRWEAVFNADTNAAPETGWEPLGIPSITRFIGQYVYPPATARSYPPPRPAWYRVKFVAPAEYQKAAYAELYCTCVDGEATYYLNGQRAGASAMRDLPIRVRMDDKLLYGQTNELRVLLKEVEAFNFHSAGGIRGDVYLKFYPALYIDNIIVRTSVRKQTIESHVYVRNLTRHDAVGNVAADVMEEEGGLALRFDPQTVNVPAGALTNIVFTQAWTNPVLWGFAPYGTPYLYAMRHRLERGGATGESYARFGFREFGARGTNFMFNGKPFFIKGDLHGIESAYENRGFAQRYFQFLREGNMNFVRHHVFAFANDVWFDVADEVGALVEPQLGVTGQQGITGPNGDVAGIEAKWRNFIWAHANHPSIVIYSGDNECLSGETVPRPQLYAIMNMRGKLLQTLDPTRLLEWHGSPAIANVAAMGLYDNLQVFNSHPYGAPLGDFLKRHMNAYQYDGRIPVHVGEMVVAFGSSPFNWWTKEGEIIRSRTLQRAYVLAGVSLACSIRSVAEAGARGASLCAAAGTVQFGPDTQDGFAFGPWTKEASRVDRLTKDGKPAVPGEPWAGANQVFNVPSVQIKWPSLSGRGMRPTRMAAGGYVAHPLLMNWFDPSRAAYTFNVAMPRVRAAFRDADGLDVGPLAEKIAPEVVVCFAPDEVPASGAFVKVTPAATQPVAADSVMTDPQGTAWFSLGAAGRYRASATWNGKAYTTEFIAEKHPFPPRETAGYQHVQWVDLAGHAATNLSARLALPAVITAGSPRDIVYPPAPAAQPRTPSTNYVAGPFRPDNDGFIRNWLVCGPFPNISDDARTNSVGFRTDFLQSAGGESGVVPAFGARLKVVFPAGRSWWWIPGKTEIFWDYIESPKNGINKGTLSAPEMDITGPTVNVIGYAACYLQVEADTDVQLALGFNQSSKAILNGTTVGVFPETCYLRVEERIVSVHMHKGRNRLLLKTDQSSGGYAFYCRLLKDNQPFTQYTVYLRAD
ncbi:MAG: glycoside hydrolase family 2 TIM barrel-domain containing protein [Kiritimatiellae bacterium]|nr:glycoside hydrolase family 2 TIM barrel-domain containing protein [Kiritimatiellia bacterium]